MSKASDHINWLLKTVANTINTINTIRDKIETDEDNTENYVHLNQLKDDIEKLTQLNDSKSTSIGERIGKEIYRVAPRVENEVKRSADKITKEAKQFF
ncbi:MAG: hypothetical protein ACSLEN_09085 [Candidatus Malihini olakiniferum]